MKYKFQRIDAMDFVIYKSIQHIGDTHEKVFSSNVTPETQQTLNVYLDGSFELSDGTGFSQVLVPGSTSIDLKLDVYLPKVIYTEKVLTDNGTRLCISHKNNLPWFREVVHTDSISFDKDMLIIFLPPDPKAGKIMRLAANTELVGPSVFVRCWV